MRDRDYDYEPDYEVELERMELRREDEREEKSELLVGLVAPNQRHLFDDFDLESVRNAVGAFERWQTTNKDKNALNFLLKALSGRWH